ncbi:MAG: HPr kinase/phosphatase C-terminal domain-containing protein [Rhodobacteraceae bacterium]|nr:HPr kinase/phosphatase C-terminal domain-containing protein [Paracoccaceae bacterium]
MAVGPSDTTVILHATAVSVDDAALVIIGASGSGKSSLALDMMSLGARLVADDRVQLRRAGTEIIASAPDAIRGLIEARGLGILNAEPGAPCPVHAVLDLDQIETERLPPQRTIRLLGQTRPLLHNVDTPAFPAALQHYLRWGRQGT